MHVHKTFNCVMMVVETMHLPTTQSLEEKKQILHPIFNNTARYQASISITTPPRIGGGFGWVPLKPPVKLIMIAITLQRTQHI